MCLAWLQLLVVAAWAGYAWLLTRLFLSPEAEAVTCFDRPRLACEIALAGSLVTAIAVEALLFAA